MGSAHMHPVLAKHQHWHKNQAVEQLMQSKSDTDKMEREDSRCWFRVIVFIISFCVAEARCKPASFTENLSPALPLCSAQHGCDEEACVQTRRNDVLFLKMYIEIRSNTFNNLHIPEILPTPSQK